MLNHTNIPGTEKCFVFLFLAPYARTTRYEEAFLPEGKKRPRSLRSLGLASLKSQQNPTGLIKERRNRPDPVAGYRLPWYYQL